jgi:hypothetical protein
MPTVEVHMEMVRGACSGADRTEGASWAVVGAICGLAVLKVVMLAAIFTQTPPHPPMAFAPLFGASLALGALCVTLIAARSRWFLVPAIPFVLESVLSVGPQKLYPGESSFFAQTAVVYPAILVGSALILVLVFGAWRLLVEFGVRAVGPGSPAGARAGTSAGSSVEGSRGKGR